MNYALDQPLFGIDGQFITSRRASLSTKETYAWMVSFSRSSPTWTLRNWDREWHRDGSIGFGGVQAAKELSIVQGKRVHSAVHLEEQARVQSTDWQRRSASDGEEGR